MKNIENIEQEDEIIIINALKAYWHKNHDFVIKPGPSDDVEYAKDVDKAKRLREETRRVMVKLGII